MIAITTPHLSLPPLLAVPLWLVFAVCVFPVLVPEIAVVLRSFRNAPEELNSSPDTPTLRVAPAG